MDGANELLKAMGVLCEEYIKHCQSNKSKINTRLVSQLAGYQFCFLERLTGSWKVERGSSANAIKNVFQNLLNSCLAYFLCLYFSYSQYVNPNLNRAWTLHILAKCWDQYKRLILLFHTILRAAHPYFLDQYNAKKKSQGQIPYIQTVPIAALALFRSHILNPVLRQVIETVIWETRNYHSKWILHLHDVSSTLEVIRTCMSLNQVDLDVSNKQINLKIVSPVVEKSKTNNFQKKNIYNGTPPSSPAKQKIIQKSTVNDLIYDQLLDRIFYRLENDTNQHFFNKVIPLNYIQRVKQTLCLLQFEDNFATQLLKVKQDCKAYTNLINQSIISNNIDYFFGDQFNNALSIAISNLINNAKEEQKRQQQWLESCYNLALRRGHIGIEIMAKKVEQVLSEVSKPQGARPRFIRLLGVVRAMYTIVETVWKEDALISVSVSKVFSHCLEGAQNGKAMAECVDALIKQCYKNKQNENEGLRIAVRMVLWVNARDSFLFHHQQLLAKRLLDTISTANINVQEWFIIKIAEEFGTPLVASHSAMLRDMRSCEETAPLKVIRAFCWPQQTINPRFLIQLPELLRPIVQSHEQKFRQINSNNNLKWLFQKGVSLFQGVFGSLNTNSLISANGNIIVRHPIRVLKLVNGKYTFVEMQENNTNCNKRIKFQAQNIYLMILLHVDAKKSITFQFLSQLISEQTPNNLLQFYVSVLLDFNLLIINNKQSSTSKPQITNDTILMINRNFKPKKQNITVVIRASNQMQKEMRRTQIDEGRLLKGREKAVEAALVKELKRCHATGENEITFQQLYRYIKQHPGLIDFNFTQSQVKMRLEQLVKNQYCERDPNDLHVFKYIA